MLLRAAFALALVCLIPFHEPDVGLPRPPHGNANALLADLRQHFAFDIQRAAAEIRTADSGEGLATRLRAGSRDFLKGKAILGKLHTLDPGTLSVAQDPGSAVE